MGGVGAQLEHALELDPRNTFILSQLSTSYGCLREFPNQAAVLDRILALRPNDRGAEIERGVLEVTWHANPRPLHAYFDTWVKQDPRAERAFAPIRVFLSWSERDAVGMERAITLLGDNTVGPNAIQFNRDFCEGLFARMKGDSAASLRAFEAARAAQEKIVRAQPDHGPTLCVLGLIDAGLGRKEDALREGRPAMELLPLAKDAINGALVIEFFAVICAWVGEKDLAIEHLTRAAQLPGPIGYGQYKLFPFFDPLRGDPRFEKLVQSIAPKE